MLGRETVMQRMPDISLEVSDERGTAALKSLADVGVHPAKKIIALGVGSANSRAKRWPAKRFASLNDKLQTELDANVILMGSKDEFEMSEAVSRLCSKPPVMLTGKTDLAQAVAILGEVDLLISNDMGLAHIAPAVGTETIVLFGPTNPETTRPFSDHAQVVRKVVECSPCMLRDCPIDHRCMTRISGDEVFEAAGRVFNAESQSREAATEDVDLQVE